MNDHDLIKQLEDRKNAPELGGGFDMDRLWNRFASENDFPTGSETARYGFRDYLEFYVWQFSHVMFKPLAFSVAVFLLLLAGWASATNASMNALPGARYYSLKLSLEKAQMTLAFSPAQKAKLQVEFASRRLEEMVELTATSFEQDSSAVLLAVRQFKKEVQNIRSDLKVETQTSAQTQLAKEIGRKTTEYKVTVADSSAHSSEDVKEEAIEVQALLEEAEDEAVEVIITAHESAADEATFFELEKAFEKELANVQILDVSKKLKEKVEQAVILKKQGAYRRAFQLLKEIQREGEGE